MKAEVLIEMMLSEQYNSLTVSEFGAICRDTLRVEEEKFSDDVMTALDLKECYDGENYDECKGYQMKNDKTLAWLLDENWQPKVTKHIGMKAEEFDNFWSKSMGYNSINEMNKHNYKRDKNRYLTYGDKNEGLI